MSPTLHNDMTDTERLVGEVEYDAARETARAASKAFRLVTDDYRARRIGDDEYLTARAVHKQAMEAFDVAESKFITANGGKS